MRARLIDEGEDQIVVFPPSIEMPGDEVRIEQHGDSVVLTPLVGDAAPGNET